MKSSAFMSNVFFSPILSAKYPPRNGVVTPAIARMDPIHPISSTDKALGRGLSGPEEDRGATIVDVQPIAIAEQRLDRLTGIKEVTHFRFPLLFALYTYPLAQQLFALESAY